jgi:hypothetical protein
MFTSISLISLFRTFIQISLAYAVQNRFGDSGRYALFTTRESFSRKDFIFKNVGLFSAGVGTTHVFSAPKGAYAINIPFKDSVPPETTSFGEALRQSAAKLPGYGPTDIFYPLNWKGTWTLRREDQMTNSSVPKSFTYPFRFIQSVDKDSVIADRSYNELNYWEAVNAGDQTGKIVQSIQWTETNPNDLNILFTDGLQRNLKVTKRASERTSSTVSSSEFQRILEDKTYMDGNTVPKLVSHRILTKWKMVTDNHIEGIEIVYDMNVGDAADLSDEKLRQPKLISKSRFYLDR